VNRFLSDGAWVAIGQFIGATGTLVGLRALTETASPAMFGTYVLVLGIVLLLQSIALYPLSQAFLRFHADTSSEIQIQQLQRVYVWQIIRVTAIVAMSLFVVGSMWASVIGWSVLIGLILAVTFAVEAARTVQLNLVSALRRQREFGAMTAIDGWLRPLCAAAGGILVPDSLLSMLLGQLVGVIAIVTISTPLTRLDVASIASKPVDENAKMLSASMRRFGRPLVPSALIGWVSGLADRYVVAAIAGVADAGMYAAVYGLVSRPFLLANAVIESTLRQPLYEAASRNTRLEESRILNMWQGLVLLVASSGLILIVLFHDTLTSLFLGKDFSSGSSLMPWIACGYVFYGLSQVYERICFTYRATSIAALVRAVGAALSVAIVAAATIAYGIVGAAMSAPLSFGTQCILLRYISIRVRRSNER
jgi:O-antigen/teichoic acid export membrane protein